MNSDNAIKHQMNYEIGYMIVNLCTQWILNILLIGYDPFDYESNCSDMYASILIMSTNSKYFH